MTSDQREFVYRVDAQNRILLANQEWFAFAQENGVTKLKPADVIGWALWDFIANPEIKYLFEVLLGKVRQTGEQVTLGYRCDSPNCRRFMELTIVPQPRQEVEFRSRILREEFRDVVHCLSEKIERSKELLIMCSWCKKVHLTNGSWVEVEEAVKALDLFHVPFPPQISHSICAECRSVIEKVFQQSFPRRTLP